MKTNLTWAAIVVLYLFLIANPVAANFSYVSNYGTNSSYSKAHSWLDYDEDGYLDLFLANGYYGGAPNYMLRNIRNGVFEKNDLDNYSSVCVGGFSWSNAIGDYDNDGDVDVFVGNITNGDCEGNGKVGGRP